MTLLLKVVKVKAAEGGEGEAAAEGGDEAPVEGGE
jgi:hypothetical protein